MVESEASRQQHAAALGEGEAQARMQALPTCTRPKVVNYTWSLHSTLVKACTC